ncbi:helix-turn-helix domain-containing protein [Lacrimispora saccharolytica]|uniref:Helix-turn-helix domain-containing protein n=1 Tax=Mordavella massiliensis TaxID=1871024 RepID=A0A938WZY9_9CLOT|nr:helix-turn-helix domain-containing protein [Mordavella massiliensis]MBM6825544.1 helix-turn-helix domain-containing protein [Mordavella massiliensis]MDM8248005.1 helix-turn-helix domain-containing protein [Lacrimispora saccharolytica]
MNGYMTTKEAAEKWNITVRQVQNHCKSGRITGVMKVGTNWLIPEGTQRPKYTFVCECDNKDATK